MFFGLFIVSTPKSHAQGIPTHDQDEIIETIGVIAKQVMQFEVMLNQLKMQILNTASPLFFIYDQVQDIRSQIQSLDNLSTTYQILGGIDDFVKDNKNLGDYIATDLLLALKCEGSSW